MLSTLCILLSLIVHLPSSYAATLSFAPSSTNNPDEYCLEESQSISYGSSNTYCDDIDAILTNYCGNATFLTMIHYESNALNPTENECVFYLQNEQNISKTYVLSDDIAIANIKFIAESPVNIVLSQSFLSITSYEGFIDIININFTTDGSTFSLVDISPNNPGIDLSFELCQFMNINAVNGSIVNIPQANAIHFNETYEEISIAFKECLFEGTTAQYGGILYIERNNVYVTFSACDIQNSTVSAAGSGGLIQWICQSMQHDVDLCGDLYITETDIHLFDNNVFTIDLSADPSQLHFILEVTTSTFSDINGVIFNFNHNDDVLAPSNRRIQEQNVFVDILHSNFTDNGRETGTIQQWNYRTNQYIDMTAYTQNGTIFTLNSLSVPNITIQSSNFTNNAALYGTIFHWFCSRNVKWQKDNYCGSIALQNNIFHQNTIDESDYFTRYGSLIYAQIRSDMQFNLHIHQSQFTENSGSLIYFDESTDEIQFINLNNSNSSRSDIDTSISMIFVEDSQFISNQDVKQSNVGAIFTLKGASMIETYIMHSLFKDNICKSGSAIFCAEYSPLISVSDSNFTGNAALGSGLIDIRLEEEAIIEIQDSYFTDNGWYSLGDYAGEVSIISTGEDVAVSLDIVRSSFIENKHGYYGCFKLLHTADIRILHSVFDSNEGHRQSVLILYLKDGGNLNISHSIFNANSEISGHFDGSAIQGMFNINKANLFTEHVTFTNNVLISSGIFSGVQNIDVSASSFVGNQVSSLFSSTSDGSVIIITESNFTTNSVEEALVNGSIISAYGSNADISIDQCIFDNNRVHNGYGGALYISDKCTLSVTNSVIYSSYANGGGGFIFAVGDTTIDISDVQARYCTTYGFGGFIYASNAELNMTRVILKDSYAKISGGAICSVEDSTLYLNQCDFESNAAGFGGGAIYVLRTKLICDECSTNNNHAKVQGGFLYMDDASYVRVNTADLLHDSAGTNGGVIYITNTSESITNQCYFECNDCTVFNASAAYGAMLFAEDGNKIILNDNEVTSCKADYSSALFIYNSHVNITRSAFERNEAGIATGVIMLARDSAIDIIDSYFTDNTGGQYAGAVYIGDNNIVSILHSVFENNTADIGGAIVVQTGYGSDKEQNHLYLEIENTSFVHNIAYMYGGSIWIQRSGSAMAESAELYSHDIQLLNNKWYDNTAVEGGALWIGFAVSTAIGSMSACDPDASDMQTVNIINNTFHRNYALRDNDTGSDITYAAGGAFYFSCLNANISETDFNSCHADTFGGVAYLRGTNIDIEQSSFTSEDMVQNDGQLFHIYNLEVSDDVFHMKRSIIHGFQHDDDTNIYSLITVADGISAILFDDIQFYDNALPLFYQQAFLSPLVRFDECQFETNTAHTIINMEQTTFQLDADDDDTTAITQFISVHFNDNEVTNDLIRLPTSYAVISDSVIENNANKGLYSTFVHVANAMVDNTQFLSNTGLYQGILSIAEHATVSIQDTIFRDNHVDVTGGAIHSYADLLSIDNCTFADNSADLAGGHIVHFEGELHITHSTFSDGSTEGNGGAIWRDRYYATTAMITNITDTIFERNTAGFHGGAILHGTISRNKETQFVLNEVRFTENEANISGAAIYIRNKYDITLDIDNEAVYYTDNIAHSLGGDIMSWPKEVHISSEVDTLCPNCTVDIAVHTTDIFNTFWPPHDFKQYLFESTTTNISNISSIKETAIVFNSSIDIKHSMSSSNSSFVAHLDIHAQSAYFTKGNGTETFAYYPAIFGDELTLTVIGLLTDGSTIFDSKSISFTVTECLAHQGALTWFHHDGFKCDWCEMGHFRLMPTHSASCHACLAGLKCDGRDNIYVENDYYPIIRRDASSLSFLTELEAIECAPATCCLAAECSVWDTTSLCPAYRDGSSQLCSKCDDGYSVSPYSNECMQCDGWSLLGGFGYMYFLFPFFFYGGLIWWWGRKHTFDADLSFWEVYIFKTLMFFYQVTPSIHIFIPDPSESGSAADVVEGLFNFQIPVPNMCAFDNMTNLQKMLLSLIMPIACIIWVFIFWSLDKIGCCRRFNSKSAGKCVLKFFLFKAVIKFSINVYAVITRLSLYLLKCKYFDDGSTGLYYAADTECWEAWSALPVFGAVMAGVGPIGLIIKLWYDRKNKQRTAIWHLLTLGYKKRAWWYEAYRMFCRLFVICFVVLSVPELYRLTWIRNAVFCFLTVHLWMLPYSRHYTHDLGFDINHTETGCLFVLCILTILADYQRDGVLKAYNILKLVPLCAIPFLVAWKYILHWKFKQFVPEIKTLKPQNTAEFFHSPRSPYNISRRSDRTATGRSDVSPSYMDEDDDDDEMADIQVIGGQYSMHSNASMFDDKEALGALLAPPQAGSLHGMDRSDSASRDYGLSVRLDSERSDHGYGVLSQVDDSLEEEEDEEDDDEKEDLL